MEVEEQQGSREVQNFDEKGRKEFEHKEPGDFGFAASSATNRSAQKLQQLQLQLPSASAVAMPMQQGREPPKEQTEKRISSGGKGHFHFLHNLSSKRPGCRGCCNSGQDIVAPRLQQT